MTQVDLQAIASRRVVYTMAGVEHVQVVRDRTYEASDGTRQLMDIYYPPVVTASMRTPAVLIVTGYSDAGVHRIFGRYAKDVGSNVSWAELIAASGMIAVTYVNREPVDDAGRVLRHLHEGAASLGIDRDR